MKQIDPHICQICNMYYDKIGAHVKNIHKLNNKDYYDMYLKDHNEDICPVCGKVTQFRRITVGYRKHCSVSCSSSDPNVQAKNKATNMRLYGVEHNWNKGELRKHQEETMLKKYKVRHNWQSGKLRSKEKFKISELEQYFMDKLDELNIDFKYRYFDESGRYPYECDFYLPDTDTFIEINGTALHDNHIFDSNSEKDVEHLEYLKSRTDSSWYQSKVRIWLKDKEKYDYAIENKLNYVIIWNDNHIDKFINDLNKDFRGIIDYNNK